MGQTTGSGELKMISKASWRWRLQLQDFTWLIRDFTWLIRNVLRAQRMRTHVRWSSTKARFQRGAGSRWVCPTAPAGACGTCVAASALNFSNYRIGNDSYMLLYRW